MWMMLLLLLVSYREMNIQILITTALSMSPTLRLH